MDDLTTLKGIGKATAKRLADAGITSFVALASTSPEQFQAIDKLGGSPTEWAEWVAEARKRVPPAPVDLEKATPDQVKDQAAKIDAARAKLADAGTAAAAAQASGDAEAIDAARIAVEAAQAELDALIGPGTTSYKEAPAGAGLGQRDEAEESAGSTTEQASQPAGSVTPPGDDPEGHNSTDTTASEAEDEEAGEIAAGLLGANGEDDADQLDEDAANRALVALAARVQRHLDEGGDEGALAFIASERRRLESVMRHLQRFDAELVRQERECVRTHSVWPVDVIRFDGAEQPIGIELKVDPRTAAALLASGAALDHDPAEGIEDA